MCFVVGPWKPLGWFLTRFEPCCCCNKPKAEAASCLFVCHKARQKSLALDTKRSSLSFQLQLHFSGAKEQKGGHRILLQVGDPHAFWQTFTPALLSFFNSLIVLQIFFSFSIPFSWFYDFCNFLGLEFLRILSWFWFS